MAHTGSARRADDRRHGPRKVATPNYDASMAGVLNDPDLTDLWHDRSSKPKTSKIPHGKKAR